MALPKQNIDLIFNQGLTKKRDDKTSLNGKYADIKNMSHDGSDTLVHRGDWAAYGNFGAGQMLGTWQNSIFQIGVLEATSNKALYTVESDAIAPNIAPTNTSSHMYDFVTVGNFSLYLWEDPRTIGGGTFYRIVDNTTKISSPVTALATAKCRLVIFADVVGCVSIDPSTGWISYCSINLTAVTDVFSAVTAIDFGPGAMTPIANSNLDVCTDSAKATCYVAWSDNASSKTHAFAMDSTAAQVVADITVSTLGTSAIVHVNVFADDTVMIANATSASATVWVFDSTLALVGPALGNDLYTSVSVPRNLTSVENPDNLGQMFVWYEDANSSHADLFEGQAFDDGSVTVAELWAVNMRIISRAYANTSVGGDSSCYLPCAEINSQNNTGYLLNTDSSDGLKFVAKFQQPNVSWFPDAGHVPNTMGADTDTVSWLCAVAGATTLASGALDNQVDLVRVDMLGADQTWKSFVEYHGLTYVAASIPLIYDGATWSEADFNQFPTIGSITGQGAGNTLPAWTYYYRCIFEWTDAQGTIHQSIPSAASSVTITLGQHPELKISQLQVTKKTGVVTIRVFRSPDAKVYAEVQMSNASATSPAAQVDAGVIINGKIRSGAVPEYVVYARDITVTTNAPGQILYAVGETENEPVPSCKGLAVHQNRLVACGLENPYQIAYGKEIQGRDGSTGFSELEQRLSVPGDFGRVTGLASMDDKLIVFTERRPFVVFGAGPTRAGSDNGFSLPTVQSGEAGVKFGAFKSVIRVEQGVWFSSDKGIRMIDRSLNLARGDEGLLLGCEVDLYAAAIVATSSYETKNQTWFHTPTQILIYDSQFNHWSRFTGETSGPIGSEVDASLDIADAVFVNSQMFYLGTIVSGGGLFSYDPHAGTVSQGLVETAWIHTGGIGGFQRLYEVDVIGALGDTIIGSVLRIDAAYDYTNATAESRSVVAAGAFAGASNGILYTLKVAQQKCNAFKIKVVHVQSDDTTDKFKWSGMSLLVGVKPGTSRSSNARRAV